MQGRRFLISESAVEERHNFDEETKIKALVIAESAEQTLQTLKTVGVNDSEEFIEAYKRLGVVHLRAGELDEAKKYFERILNIDKKNQLGWYCRGLVFFWKSDYKQAIEDFKQALELNPIDTNAWNTCR